jgi:hypothetical protein
MAEKAYPIDEALKAQRALRRAAGLEEELFPVEAFVGMISDEIEALRMRGMADDQIAAMIEASSSIRITADQIRENYATPEQRRANEA